MHEREARFDAGDARRLRRLERHPGAMVGRDDVDRARRESRPERVALRRVAERRPDRERLGAPVAGAKRRLLEHEPMRGDLARDVPPTSLGARDLGRRLVAGQMEDEQPRSGEARQGDRAVHRLRLRVGRARGLEPRRPGLSVRLEAPAELADHVVVLGVQDGEASALGDGAHRPEDRRVGQPVALVGHVELEGGHAAREHRRHLCEPRRVRVAEVEVEPVVDHRLARSVGEALLEAVDE